MTTASTAGIGGVIRDRLLSFVPEVGPTLGASLTNRLWRDAPPDNAIYPFGVMRLINQITDAAYSFDRERVDVELMLFGRPRSAAQSIEDMADVADQAMLRWADSSSGLVYSRERTRDTLPPPTEPADREVVQVRCVYSLVVWPAFLTQYSPNP